MALMKTGEKHYAGHTLAHVTLKPLQAGENREVQNPGIKGLKRKEPYRGG